LADAAVFPLFQGTLAIVLAYACARDAGWFRRDTGFSAVRRGSESWALFPVMFALIALIVVNVNNTTEAWKGFKTIVTVADLAAAYYLCYFNSWFRNETVGLFVRSNSLEE